MNRETLYALWPHVRVGLIAFHVAAVVLLSAPVPGNVARRELWKSEDNQAAFAEWARRLRWLGYTGKEQLEADLWALAQRYLAARNRVIWPLERYSAVTGVHQGWRMFSGARKHPAELHIDARIDGAWQPIYRPHSADYNFWQAQFTHNRMRKLMGRQSRRTVYNGYDQLAAFLARKVAHAYPRATAVRTRLYRYPVRTPDQVRAGQAVDGRYDRQLTFATKDLR